MSGSKSRNFAVEVFAVAKSIRCRLGFHRWHKEYDKERSIVVKVCQDCEKRMSTGMSGPVVMG